MVATVRPPRPLAVPRLAGTARRIGATLARPYAHVDEGRSGSSELRDRMLAPVSARDLVAQQSTWPWRSDTLRWFVSALVMPLVLRGTPRILESAVRAPA